MDQDPTIKDALRAIVTGTSVNWTAIESDRADESFHVALRDLKLVSQIANFHRSLQETADPGSSGASVHTLPSAVGLPTWGPLTLLEPIGHGSFGEVYRAWDGRLDREVALKLLRRTGASPTVAGSRAVQEGRLLARVRHPNIVTVHGADVIDGQVGIWMEFVRGRTLEALVLERGAFEANEAAAIGLAVCRALGAVHRAGLVHRDVKAQNVMREDDGRIVLMDFGTGQEIARTRGGQLAGTPAYLAPEVLNGDAATPKSDAYSLGVLLYFLTAASYPVPAATLGDLREAHGYGLQRRLDELRPDLPQPFVALVGRALAVNPLDRFETMDALDTALSALIDEPRPDSLPVGPSSAAMTARSDRRAAVALTAAVVLLALASAPVGRSSLFGVRRTRAERFGSGSAAPGIAVGPTVRRVDVPGFIASGEPSRTGRWLAGVDWMAGGNLALLDLFSGARHPLTSKSDRTDGFTERSAISSDEQVVAYSWYTSARQDTGELRTVGIDGSNPKIVYRNDEGLNTPVAWSPDGRRVLVLRERFSAPDLAWIDTGDGRANELVRLTSFPRNISLSPDGGLVAYDQTSRANAADRDLYVCDAVTGRAMPLLIHPANDLAPLWVPGGAGVVFSSNRGGNLGLWYVPVTRTGEAAGEPRLVRGDMGRMSPIGFGRDEALFYHAVTGTVDVYVADVDLRAGRLSHPETVATRFVGTNLFSDWSPDGRSLVFTSRRGEVGFEPRSQVLVIRNLGTTDERVLAPDLNNLSWPRWAPDGQSIVVKGDGRLGSGFYRVSVRDGSATPLLIRDGVLNLPEWQPQGRELFFVVPRGRIQALDVRTKAERHVRDGGFMFALSRDGCDLAFARREPNAVTIHIAPADLGTPRAIFTMSANVVVELAGWSSDGAEVLVTRRERAAPTQPDTKPTELLAVPVTGGNPRSIATLDLNGPRSMRLSPDGTHLAFEAGYPSSSMWVLEQFINR